MRCRGMPEVSRTRARPWPDPGRQAGAAMTISVVLASYNHARFVEAALAALLAQVPAPTEIIVIDDASTDGSLAVVERFARANLAIRLLVNTENLGVIRSQKQALTIASAPFVYFAAADDI